MRVFLDENVDLRLASRLIGFDVETVHSRGWSGVTNGELLRRLEESFDVLVSHDQGLATQHNWSTRKLALIVVVSRSTRFATYSDKTDLLKDAIEKVRLGTATLVEL
jgi:hypothetical protein